MWAHFPPRELREEGSTPVGDTTLASWMSLKGEVDNALGDLEPFLRTGIRNAREDSGGRLTAHNVETERSWAVTEAVNKLESSPIAFLAPTRGLFSCVSIDDKMPHAGAIHGQAKARRKADFGVGRQRHKTLATIADSC